MRSYPGRWVACGHTVWPCLAPFPQEDVGRAYRCDRDQCNPLLPRVTPMRFSSLRLIPGTGVLFRLGFHYLALYVQHVLLSYRASR